MFITPNSFSKLNIANFIGFTMKCNEVEGFKWYDSKNAIYNQQHSLKIDIETQRFINYNKSEKGYDIREGIPYNHFVIELMIGNIYIDVVTGIISEKSIF